MKSVNRVNRIASLMTALLLMGILAHLGGCAPSIMTTEMNGAALVTTTTASDISTADTTTEITFTTTTTTTMPSMPGAAAGRANAGMRPWAAAQAVALGAAGMEVEAVTAEAVAAIVDFAQVAA